MKSWVVPCGTFFLGVLAGLSSCKQEPPDQEDVIRFFGTHKIGHSADVAIVKNGNDYLAVIFGMNDDLSACMDLIKPYNDDPSLAVIPGRYACVPLNH